MKTLIITINEQAEKLAATISAEIGDCEITGLHDFKKTDFTDCDCIVFIGALGICVRSIVPLLTNKYADPAVICVDSLGNFAISVASGHVGGANLMTQKIARAVGAMPVVTTQSDNAGLWALDTLGAEYGWETDAPKGVMNHVIATLVNGRPVALLLDVKDRGTAFLERTKPANVQIIKSMDEAGEDIEGIVAVTPRVYETKLPAIYFRPKVLSVGIGCRKGCNPEGAAEYIESEMAANGLSFRAIKSVATIDLKKDEPLVAELAARWECVPQIYSAEELADIEVPNPSQKVKEVTGVWGVAESCAILSSEGGYLLIEKQKCCVVADNEFTFSAAQDASSVRCGHIEIVGAGPGDPELVSVRGKHFLQAADLILYAGSLVPVELTYYAKPGCVVRSSASLALEEQFELMKEFYDRGLLVVRLHTGDPCIYGAIQEQMAYFDRYGMSYHITPGISSFLAAAAELKSQFTIPEEVQTIILTRGEGRTPMPEREQLHKLAKSQSTMCIFLSAAIADAVQKELLMEYPPETPVAVCHKLTWKDQKIYRGTLDRLAAIVKDNNLTLTTMLVVGRAIDNREGLSKLYHKNFKHLFRP